MISPLKQILITENTLLSDIQVAFTSYYPFLKIEFLKISTEQHNTQKPKKLDASMAVKVITSSEMPVTLNIESKRTISEISFDIKKILGLAVEFSRKSGNVWNIITLTDSWTLEDQNDAGKFISTEMSLPPAEH